MNAKLSNSKHKDQNSNLVHMWLYSHCAQENDRSGWGYSDNLCLKYYQLIRLK